MRLWSVHPAYLDRQGLIACWREALLAQKVLAGQTRGYTRHPQLTRFREQADPAGAIGRFLRGLAAEAGVRGYAFDVSRITSREQAGPVIDVTDGQLAYEAGHLRAKLVVRSPQWLETWPDRDVPEPHPLFRMVPGPVAAWEVSRRAQSLPNSGPESS